MRFTIFFFLTACALSAMSQSPAKKPAPTQAQKPAATPAPPPGITPQQLMQHYFNKYTAALRWNDPATAKDALYDVILMNPSNDSLIFQLAYYYYEQRQYASALLIAQDLLSQSPKNPAFLELAGSAAEEIGVQDRALQHYESLFLQTNSTETLYKIAFLQYGLKRSTEAKANVDILLTKPETDTLKVVYNDAAGNPKEYVMKASVLNLKGLLAQDAGEKDLARKTFNEVLVLAPDFVAAKQNLEKLK